MESSAQNGQGLRVLASILHNLKNIMQYTQTIAYDDKTTGRKVLGFPPQLPFADVHSELKEMAPEQHQVDVLREIAGEGSVFARATCLAKLLAGAIDCLSRHGAADEQITVVWVPGACEITMAAKKLAQSSKYVAVLCLGAVIRGQTSHYDYVCQQIVRGIGQINYDSAVPAVFGVLTCETLEQAVDRAGSKMGNAGADAALTAMETVSVMQVLSS